MPKILLVDDEEPNRDFLTRRLVKRGFVVVEAIDGSLARVDAQSICVHGDSASAVEMAQAVRAALEQDGVVLRSFVDPA